LFVKKTIKKRIEPWTFQLKGGFLTNTSIFFSLKLLCKKYIYNVNHCANTIKNLIFFLVGHCTIDASNPMPHLTCYACLMLA
jgi:hypothetical protein